MTIHHISDLHLDFYFPTSSSSSKFDTVFSKFSALANFHPADVLIIAGDLGHYNSQIQQVLLKLKETYAKIIIVRGNHDMFLISKSQQSIYGNDSRARYLKLKYWCKDNDIHYLDGDTVTIDNITFGGVGMYFDDYYYTKLKGSKPSDNELTEFFNNTMNDSRLIMFGKPPIKVPTTYGGSYIQSSFNHSDYFKSELSKLQSIPQVDIMVSHFSPINYFEYLSSPYSDDFSSTFYMFNGYDELARINPKHWIFGHTHTSATFTHESTQFHVNAFGYPHEPLTTTIKSITI